MLNTPLLFIIFNRPKTTNQVFEVIRRVRPLKLYIAADAPRPGNLNDQKNCHETRLITEKIDWTCDVKRLYREKNLGCGIAVSEAIHWFFSHESEGIILEDDCLPHPDFFSFASLMLDRFRSNKKIISINGSNLGYELLTNNNYTFSRFMNMWGWATWNDRVNKIDYTMAEWKNIKHKTFWVYWHAKQGIFDVDINWYRLWRGKFSKVAEDPRFTWDWQWIFFQLKNNKYSVVPARNLVTNIGFDEDATHTIASDNPSANLPLERLPQPWKHPITLRYDRIYEEKFIKWVWCYHKRLPVSFYIKKCISEFLKKSK